MGRHGLKTALLTRQGRRVYFTAADPCETAFEPSTMDDSSATRLNVDLRGSEDMIAFFDQIDVEAPLHFAAESSKFFGKTLGIEDVKAIYSPCVKRKGDYPATLRTKLRLDGPTPTLFWDGDSKPRGPPDQWRHVPLRVRLCPSHFWVSRTSCGVSVMLEDVQLVDVVPRSPFLSDETVKEDDGCGVAP